MINEKDNETLRPPYSMPGMSPRLSRGEEETVTRLLKDRLQEGTITYYQSLLLLKLVRAVTQKAEKARAILRPIEIERARKLLGLEKKEGASAREAAGDEAKK
jgi:hypothetical protein